MTRLFPLILPDKPSPYGPETNSGDDDPDDVEADKEELSDSTESESDETTE